MFLLHAVHRDQFLFIPKLFSFFFRVFPNSRMKFNPRNIPCTIPECRRRFKNMSGLTQHLGAMHTNQMPSRPLPVNTPPQPHHYTTSPPSRSPSPPAPPSPPRNPSPGRPQSLPRPDRFRSPHRERVRRRVEIHPIINGQD